LKLNGGDIGILRNMRGISDYMGACANGQAAECRGIGCVVDLESAQSAGQSDGTASPVHVSSQSPEPIQLAQNLNFLLDFESRKMMKKRTLCFRNEPTDRFNRIAPAKHACRC